MLSDDYFAVPEDQIRKIESVLTVMGGQIVHAKGPYRSMAPAPLPVNPDWSPVASARAAEEEGRYLAQAMRGPHACGHAHADGDNCAGIAHAHSWIAGEGGMWSLSCNCMVA